MNKPPQEIEVKIQPTEPQMEQLQNWLTKSAEFCCTLNSQDYYLDNPNKSILFKSDFGFIDSTHALRVRIDQNKSYLTLKVNHRDNKTNEIIRLDEHESEIANGQTVLNIFYELGYKHRFVIKKTRLVYKYQAFEIAIDEVEKLGKFVEIELKADTENAEGIKQIFSLLKQIGFDSIKTFTRGYAAMFTNPGHDFSKVVKL